MKQSILSIAVLLFSISTISQADDTLYKEQVSAKAKSGLLNIATASAEIPKSIINTTNESNLFFGIVGGVIKGSINTVGRMLVGMTDLVTAPIPTEPIVHPHHVWQDTDTDTSYGKIFRHK